MTTEALTGALKAPDPVNDPAYLDHLTTIWNRRHFERKLNDWLEDRESATYGATILLLDLDRFKVVNDSLGHAVGDTLLCLVAQRVSSILGTGDVFARLGGDEFGILICSEFKALELASRLIELVQRTYLIDGCPVNIGVSIGLASAPKDATDRGELMRCADLALYQSKRAGRNRFTRFEPTMAVKAREKRDLEIALRKAVALKQLVMQYRPQLDIETKHLMGLEAVLLWKHPTRGLIEATEFIPLAEEIGVAVPIGEWALRAVCREAARWPDDVPCALALSPVLFESLRFYETVSQALTNAGIEGHKLELEVTEQILLRDGKAVLTMLECLRSLGVRVAVDSFGTGMASLSQMVGFPLDKIKISRSLVEENGASVKSRAIVRAIAALGASLGVSTMVEGVNTQEHLERIQADGCSSVQGCLLGKAVAPGDLQALIDDLFAPSTSSSLHEVSK